MAAPVLVKTKLNVGVGGDDMAEVQVAFPDASTAKAPIVFFADAAGNVAQPLSTTPTGAEYALPMRAVGIGAVTEKFTSGQVLADQSGASAVLTFTFAQAMDMVWVSSRGGVSRADPFGGSPTATLGIYCDDGIPQPLTVTTTTVKVYAPSGATVTLWGYRF
jgi:hypothetical protein